MGLSFSKLNFKVASVYMLCNESLKYCGLEFSKLNFKVASVYMLCNAGLKNCGLEFSKLSTKVASVYILPQSSVMLNKDTLGVKKWQANKQQPYLCPTKIFGIS